jgi:hypothetical protein
MPGEVKEARERVEQVRLDRGAHIAHLWRQYIESAQAPGELPGMMMAPGVDGTLNMRHPDAGQALLDAAARGGARIERGVQDVKISRENMTEVSFVRQRHTVEMRTPLVVGGGALPCVVWPGTPFTVSSR